MQFDNDKSDGLQIFPYQISGKKPKYIDNESGLVYKLSSKAEISFYERIRNSCTTDDCYGLKQFLPTYLGVSRGMYLKQDKDPTNNQLNESSSSVSGELQRQKWIEHIHSRNKGDFEKSEFLVMRNIVEGFAYPNIIDLKLGRKKKGKESKEFSTTKSHHFRLNGAVVHLSVETVPQEIFLSKYYCRSIHSTEIMEHLALFFYNGSNVDKELLSQTIGALADFILAFKACSCTHFIGSSLFIAYDSSNHSNVVVKLLDFDACEESPIKETTVEEGLLTIHWFLSRVREQSEQLQKLLSKRELRCFGEYELIPVSKLSLYECD